MNVKIDDIMIDKPIVTTPHTSVAHAKQLMRDHHISSLPVVGPDGDAVGILSASDLLNDLPDEKPVSQMMTRQVYSVPRYDDAHVAARIMRNHHIHHLVVTHERRVVGVLSAYDLLAFIEDHRFVGKNAFTPSTGRTPRRV